MKIWAKILKQYSLPWIGGFKIILMQVLFYVSCISFVLVAVTAYHTTLKPYLLSKLPWMSFPMFLVSIAIVLTMIMIMEYKFVMSSLYLFTSKQMTLVERLDAISVKLDKLLENDKR